MHEIALADSTEQPLAKSWPRYWARSLDVFIEVFILGALLGLLAPLFVTSAPLFLPPYQVLLYILALPCVMVFDAAIAAIFGNTFGKWLVGIAIRGPTGEKPNFKTLLKRNFGMLWWGLGLGVPIVSIFTLIACHRGLSHGDEMKWDMASGTHVYRSHDSIVRVYAAAALILAIYGVSTAFQLSSTPERMIEEIARAVQAESPQMLDSAIRLDGAVTGPGLALTYRYTMVNVTNLTHDILEVRKYVAGLAGPIRINSCNDVALRSLLVAGATLTYAYRDANGATLQNIDVRESMCSQEVGEEQ